MEFVIPVPDNRYYLWQMLVQAAHFREMGYEDDAHYLVIYFGQPSDILQRIFDSDALGCYIHAYPDTREDHGYSASMKPWLLGQYFNQFPEQAGRVHNYLDPDVMFTHPMDFTPFEQYDGRWYGSDTRSYTGAQYIREKGEQLFLDLCEIAGVSPDLVLEHDHNSIGAQYFIKDAEADFWFNVERHSVKAYHHMIATRDKYQPEGHQYPIQAWCAEMYMQQYQTIKAGFTPIADERLQFHWANHNAADWDERACFHNAGVAAENGRDFCKITWQSSPFRKEITVSPESASSRYVDLIRKTEVMFPDLIWE